MNFALPKLVKRAATAQAAPIADPNALLISLGSLGKTSVQKKIIFTFFFGIKLTNIIRK